MCGIAGFLNLDGRPAGPEDEAVLGAMIGTLAHRGPDGSGLFLDGPAGLAHARLSVIDLTGGAQPMVSADGQAAATYNGEVFNYLELGRELAGRGFAPRTSSDTEVVLHAFQDKGPDCLRDFNGQFAFAARDRRRRLFMLARDRVGICPLYYALHGDRLLFASEIKALFAHPDLPRRLDLTGLDQFFTFWTPIAPRTVFEGVHELPPGHRLVVEEGGPGRPAKIRLEKWWELDFTPSEELARAGEGELAERLGELLGRAIRLRLRSDVEVGAYLSGGLDSSFVTARARREVGDGLRAFSVAFADAAFDESPWQRLVAESLGTRLTTAKVAEADIGADMGLVVWHAERPTFRTAPAPLYRLSKLVRDQGCKVALTGEGADEFLVGYDVFKEAKIKEFWARRPDSTLRPLLFKRLYPYLRLPREGGGRLLGRFFAHGLAEPDHPFFSHWTRWAGGAAIRSVFFSGEARRELAGYDCLEEFKAGLPESMGRWDPVARAQWLEATTFLPGALLGSQGDRMLMANGVEGRFPFLDHEVVEFCNRIPSRRKMRVLDEKRLLRLAARDDLPPSVSDRRKQPYRAPVATSLLRGPVAEVLRRELSPARVEAAGVFSPSAAAGLLAKAERAGGSLSERDSMALLGVFSTQLLHAQFVETHPVAAPEQPPRRTASA